MGVVGAWKGGRVVDGPTQWSGCNKGAKGPYIPAQSLSDSSQVFPLGRGLGAARTTVEAHDWRICRLWKRPRVIHRAARWWVYVVWKDSGWVSSSAGRSTKRRLGAKRTAQTYPPGPCSRIAIATCLNSLDGLPAKSPLADVTLWPSVSTSINRTPAPGYRWSLDLGP